MVLLTWNSNVFIPELHSFNNKSQILDSEKHSRIYGRGVDEVDPSLTFFFVFILF